MKNILVALILCSCSMHSTLGQASLDVEIALNRLDAGGMVRFALCKGAVAYETVEGCQDRSAAATGEVVVIKFLDLPPGEYAIKAFHDVNSNGEMDFNMVGIPKEPYGFSSDATAMFSPPAFEEAKFIVVAGHNVTRFKMKN